jgi:hypothetical protein
MSNQQDTIKERGISPRDHVRIGNASSSDERRKQTHLGSPVILDFRFHVPDERTHISIWNRRTPSSGLRHCRFDLLRAEAHVEEEVALHEVVTDLRLPLPIVLLV